MGEHETADMSKHTDAELRDGIAKAEEQEPRVATEDSDEALEAQHRQREAMEEELQKRED